LTDILHCLAGTTDRLAIAAITRRRPRAQNSESCLEIEIIGQLAGREAQTIQANILGIAGLILGEISLFPEERVSIIARVASPVRKFQTQMPALPSRRLDGLEGLEGPIEAHFETVEKIRRAFENAGVEFMGEPGPGVRLKPHF
jgi:hypothetical protein